CDRAGLDVAASQVRHRQGDARASPPTERTTSEPDGELGKRGIWGGSSLVAGGAGRNDRSGSNSVRSPTSHTRRSLSPAGARGGFGDLPTAEVVGRNFHRRTHC